MYKCLLRQNPALLQAGFYAWVSSKDLSEGAGHVLGETKGRGSLGLRGPLGRKPVASYEPFSTLLRTRTDSYGRARTDSYGRTRTDSYGRTRTAGISSLIRTRTDSYGRARTDSYGRARTDSYGRARTDSYGRPRTDSYGRNADVFTTDRFSLYYGLVRTRTDCLGGFTTDSYGRWLGQVGRSVADVGGLKRLCSRDIRGYIEVSGIASSKSCTSGGGYFNPY